MGNLAQAGNQLVPHGSHPGHVLVHVVAGILQSSSHAADTGNILRTSPLAPLLGTAFNQVLNGEALADIQGAYALGAVELVAGQAKHVDVLFLDVDVQMAHRLNRIGVEGHARFFANGADFCDGQNGADFIVGVHNCHQAGIFPDGILDLLGGDGMALAHIQVGYLKAFLLQLGQSVQHSVVLKGGGDNVLLILPGAVVGGGTNGLVVCLAAAGGEDNLSGLAA